MYDNHSFTPSAKLVDGKSYSIISDYLGTPILSYDENGNKVWERELDIYGKARKGDSRFIPFLYQGQYYDAETELAYNRFRYYSPDTGMYISQDPIGLVGGMPNMYSYVSDSNIQYDPFGLECWGTARKKFWKQEAKTNPNKYSSANLSRMNDGKAPRMTVEVFNPKTGRTEIKDYSMELHHRDIPQRVGGDGVHNSSNLDALTPFEHEAVDPFRNTGRDLIRVIDDVGSWGG